jgi:hypothetical protein
MVFRMGVRMAIRHVTTYRGMVDGVTVDVRRDAVLGEWSAVPRVHMVDDLAAAYFTDDREDAMQTAQHRAEHYKPGA